MNTKQQARIALTVGLGILVLGLPAGLAGCGKKSKPVYYHESDRRPNRVYRYERRDVRRRPPVYYQAPARQPRPILRHDDRRDAYRDGRDGGYDRDRRNRDHRSDQHQRDDRGHQRYEKRRGD